MKVCHVITGLGTGGAESQLRALLQHTRHEAEVVTLHNPGALAAQIRGDGVRVTDLGMTGNTDLRAVATLTSLLRASRPDVVHTHLYRACLYGRLAARLAGVPRIVATEHSLLPGVIEGRPAGGGVRLLYRATERLGDVTIAVSAAVRDELTAWGVEERRTVVVPNGVDLAGVAFDPVERLRGRAEFGIPDDAVVVGAVGRLVPGKEFDQLLTALADQLGPRRLLLLVGTGPERDRLERMGADLGIAEHVLFAGERPAVDLLHAMDVFASPSPAETFGLAVLEALGNGLPVVHRRCPALDELPRPVPEATRCPDLASFSRVLAGLAPRADRTCPPALAALGIGSVAAQVDDLYDVLPGGSGDHLRVHAGVTR